MAIGLGIVVGLILALTGAGGAIIAVPLLIFSLGLDVAHAAPVALFAVGSSAAIGTLMGLRAGIVRYRAAGLMSATGALVTPLGVLLAHHIAPMPLMLIFAAVLLYVAQRMFRQARQPLDEAAQAPRAAPCQLNIDSGRLHWTAPCLRSLLSIGAAAGLLSGLLGVGGGFVIVPALRKASDLPMNAIVASSLMVIALVSGAAVIAAAAAGHLDLSIAVPFAAGAIAGMLAGRRIAAYIAGPLLQQGFALVSALVAVGLVIRAASAA